MEKNRIKIGEGDNIQREIFKSSLFYDILKIAVISENNKEIYETYIYPNRFSFKKNEELIRERVKIISQRLKIEDLGINEKKIGKVEKIFYWLIFFIKRFTVKFFMPSQWIIGYKEKDKEKWNYLKVNRNEMWADPFIVYENGKYYIFFEEMSYIENKGHIAAGILDLKNKKVKEKKIILNKDYHLSYPFIFKEKNIWYMIPESSANKTVDLYEAIEFPFQWRLKKRLLQNIDASDTTLLKREGIWYLFTSESVPGITQNDELSIFKSEDLLFKEFEKTKEEPILSDARIARMGGNFFEKDGKLYRPSQDCSKRYGYKLNINIVTSLEENDYKEKLIKKIEHPKDIRCIAMHTYNICNDIEVADFKIIDFNILSLIGNIKIGIKKVFKILIK